MLPGASPKIDELSVAWALEFAEPLPPNVAAPRVARDTGNASYPMVQVEPPGSMRSSERFRMERLTHGTTRPAIAASVDRTRSVGNASR